MPILGQKWLKIKKPIFYLVSETKYVTYWLNCAYSDLLVAWQYIGITQKPHDHLLQKSGQPGLANFGPKMVKNKKPRRFTYSVKPNMLPMG